MKFLVIIIVMMSAFSGTAFAKTKVLPKTFISQKYSNVYCKQKYIPMKMEQSLNGHLLNVKFTAQRKIDQFVIKNVRGIEGVTVTKFQEQNQTGLNPGDVLNSDVELSDFSGLVYVVFDVSLTQNGAPRSFSIPVAVGKLSVAQKALRSKNIKEVKTTTQQKEGTSPLSVPPKTYHEMPVD